MTIKIDEGLPAAATVGTNAFTKPGPNDEIVFDKQLKTPGYYAHLVRFVSWVNASTLAFRAVDLTNTEQEYGPSGSDANPTNVYQVELGQVQHVYREVPSTLTGVGVSQSYMLLFLSDAYVAEHDSQSNLLVARGGPKWPAGAGASTSLPGSGGVNPWMAELAKTKAANETMKQALHRFARESSLDPKQKKLWDNLFAELV